MQRAASPQGGGRHCIPERLPLRAPRRVAGADFTRRSVRTKEDSSGLCRHGPEGDGAGMVAAPSGQLPAGLHDCAIVRIAIAFQPAKAYKRSYLDNGQTRTGHVSIPVPSSDCGAQEVFSKNLTAWRRRRGLLLKMVASDLSVSVSTLDAWETGRRFPTAEHLDRIARITGIPPCLLFCRGNGECPYRRNL
jgi:hypothetical protein